MSSDDESAPEAKPKGRRNLPKVFQDRMEEYVTASRIKLDTIAENKVPEIEPWELTEPKLDISLSESTKETTNPLWYVNEYRALKQHQYLGYSSIYTDGSKQDEKVAAASTWKYGTLKTRLPDGCTIFSAEGVALLNALKIVRTSWNKRFIIFTDSLSCLQSIQNEDLSNQIIKNFLTEYTKCSNMGKEIVLCWIPGHVGIPGNERADSHAKDALNEDITPMKIPYTDLIPTVKAYFKTIWQDQWDSSTDFLSIISPSIGRKVYDPGLTRREQVVLCRIRLNHTRLTNSYRMSKERPPTCDHCQLPMTMNHIMVNCNKYRHLREEHL